MYESPGNRVITADNLNVEISLSLVLKVVHKDPNSASAADLDENRMKIMQLVTNVNQYNELIDANIQERVRLIGRTVKASQAYTLRGDQHAQGMVEHLNQQFATHAIIFKRCIITSVVLEESIALTMQNTTVLQFEKTLSKKKFAFEQRIKNDKEEEFKARQVKIEQRKDEEERAKLEQMEKSRAISDLEARTNRVRSEWAAQTEARINSINADTDLKYNTIVAEAKLIETEIIQQATARAAEMEAEAEAFHAQTIANAQEEVAPKIAEAVQLKGKVERLLEKGYEKRRRHEQLMAQQESLARLAANENAVVFGNQEKNLLAQIAAQKLVKKNI